MIAAAVAALKEADFTVLRASKVLDTAPVGPSLRRFANAAAMVETRLDPPMALGCCLQAIENRFGRQRRGEG
ncbi:MAG: 2-amino-4-hydroxy-6-hydroxymethyldihydropteridine diphosphokinase [Sphingomonadaceae bacterium]